MDIFAKIKYRFVKSLIDISNYLDEIIESKMNVGKVLVKELNKNITFEKTDNKISIDFNGDNFQIDKEPISFFGPKGESLFKIYDSSNKLYIDDIRKGIENKYEFFLKTGEKIKFEEIIGKGIKSIIVNMRDNQYNNIFKPLCERLETKEKHLEINTNCFLPKESQSLLIRSNSKFQLIIDKRQDLIQKIFDFMKNDKKFILKIYGSNGIGKSITFLYFMTIKNEYKIIYLNLKDIFTYKQDQQEYFKNALMKYYSSNNYPSIKGDSITSDNNEYIQFNYNVYLKAIKALENKYKDSFIKGDLWDMLDSFCNYIEDDGNSLIIIDQYKDEFDNKNKLINLKKIMTKYSENKTIKFIIASSLNDNTVKEDLIADLIYIFREPIEFLKSPEYSIKTKNIEDELFKNFNFDNNNSNNNVNKEFENIYLFNIDKVDNLTKENNNEIRETKNNDVIINNNENKIINKYINIDQKLIELTEIIYINNLVSVEDILEDANNSETSNNKEDNKELFELFNFSPEAYSKFNFIFHSKSNLTKDLLYKTFLNGRFNEIEEKIDKFYKNLKENRYFNYSSDCLKYTYLMKLSEIIENNEELNLKELIQYLEVFPFKYLKIYLSKDKSIIKKNILFLNDELKNSKFIINYSYDFIEIAIAKILYKIPTSTQIDMKVLTGSGIGSLLENKIKNYLKDNKFIIRYLWNFTTPLSLINKEKKEENKYIYDFIDYKKFKLEYDEFKAGPKIEYRKYYYIIPGSQTNKLLDSVILQPFGLDSFNTIFLQITKFKLDFPSKEEYINKCFEAKKKIEDIYKIKINKVYFFFILGEDFSNEKTKEELVLKNISYFYYSIKDKKFKNNGLELNLGNLNWIEAEITEKAQENEYRYFDSKLAIINLVEKFLQKKRRLDNNIKISQNFYEAAKNHLFKKNCTIYLDFDIEKKMKEIVEKNSLNYKKNLFTFQFIFYIYPNESLYLDDKEDLIGIMIQSTKKKGKYNEKLFRYFYKGELIPNNIDLPGEYFDMKEGRKKKLISLNGTYYISKIDSIYWNRIFVFKIYNLKNNLKK